MSDNLPVRDLGNEPDTTESNPNPTQDEEVNQNITDDETDEATRIDEQISDDPTVEEDGATYDPAKQAPPEA